MRIGLDARSIISNKVCGVSRVASYLIQTLSRIDRKNEYIVYTDSTITGLNLGANFKIKNTFCSRKNPFNDPKLYSIIQKEKLDLYHAMHSWLPVFIPQRTKTVVTIHDLIPITDPNYFIKYKPFHKLFQLYFKYLIKRSVEKTDAIVTVSYYDKKELINYFHLSDEKINVVYNAVGITNDACNAVNSENVINDDYLLYLGNCKSYKNVETLIKGFSLFLQNSNNISLKLVIAGNDNCEKIRTMVNSMGIDNNIVYFVNPSDAEVGNLYANASCFVLPSKYEGFGIPVIEAMSFGVPVIISDADALVEVAGDSAMIFKKDKPEELARAIEKLIADRTLRESLRKKGYARVKEFTWESSAIKLISLYRRVLNI